MSCVTHIIRLLVLQFILCSFLVYGGRIQQNLATTYVTAGESVTFSYTVPGSNEILTWKVHLNGSEIAFIDVAQNYQGGIRIFKQFDLPPGRTSLTGATLNITSVRLEDEGYYWCELKSPLVESLLSDKYPLHVYNRPKDPTLSQVGRDVVQEDTTTTVAECKSEGGKPGATLSWWNGTQRLEYLSNMVVISNSDNDKLEDTSLSLTVRNWTRFDHRRNFTCLIEHPSYKGASKRLNYSVNVLYHPVNARIWANLTSKTVYCYADGYKLPTYSWVIPGGIEQHNMSEIQLSNLLELPENDYFECTANNDVPPAAVVRITVFNLIYPDGKPIPQLLGLPFYIWIAIGGGVLLLIIAIVVCCCCYSKRKKKKKNGSDFKAKYTSPQVKASSTRHSQPSLLDYNDMRTPDGRDSTLPPKDPAYRKHDMQRSYSLENVAERKYGEPKGGVVLMPLHDQVARDDLYNDTSLNRRASREEIDKIADHIQGLNKSWDHLARSRENLSRSREELSQSREELHVERPPPPRYDDIPDPQVHPADRESYPYMDDTVDSRNQRGPTRSYSNRNYYEHEIIPQGPFDDRTNQYRDDQNPSYDDRYRSNDDRHYDDRYQDNRRDNHPRASQQPYNDGGYRDNRPYNDSYPGDRRRDNASYDDRRRDNPPYDDRYQDNRPYNDGYGASSGRNPRNSRDFEAQRYQDDRQPLHQSDYNQRQASYGDSEFDDDQEGYDPQQGGYGYQPASMI